MSERKIAPFHKAVISAYAAYPSEDKALAFCLRMLSTHDLVADDVLGFGKDVVFTESNPPKIEHVRSVIVYIQTIYHEDMVTAQQELREQILGVPFAERGARIRALGETLQEIKAHLEVTHKNVRAAQKKDRDALTKEERMTMEADVNALTQLTRNEREAIMALEKMTQHLNETVPLEVTHENIYDSAAACFRALKRCIQANLLPDVLKDGADEIVKEWVSARADIEKARKVA